MLYLTLVKNETSALTPVLRKKGVIPHPLIVNKLLRQLAQHTAQWLRSTPQQLIAHGKG